MKDLSNDLKNLVKTFNKKSSSQGPAKPWSKLSNQYQRNTSLPFLHDDYFEPVQCELKNKESGELLCVQPNQKPIMVKEKPLESDKEVLKKHCMLKNNLIYQIKLS